MNKLMKLMGLLLALMMIAAACGDSDESSDTTAAPSDGDTTTTAAGPESDTNVGLTFDIGGRGDQSFNDSAAAASRPMATSVQ